MARKAAKEKIVRVQDGGISYLNLTQADETLKTAVLQTLIRHLGHYQAVQMEYQYDLSTLIIQHENIEEALCSSGIDPQEGDAKRFFDELEKYSVEMESMLSQKLERGEIEFPDIPFLFKIGVEVVAMDEGFGIGGIIDKVELKHSFFSGPYYQIKLKVIANTSGAVKDELFSVSIGYWKGYQKVSHLGVRIATEDDKAQLAERGAQYVRYAFGSNYCRYNGQVRRHSWYGVKSYRADGRVMVDMGSFRQIDDDQYNQERRHSGVDDNSHHHYEDEGHSATATDIKVGEDDLWRCFPYLYGFSFKAKQWGRLDVSGLSDIEWRDDSWDKLVLQDDKKQLVRAIVEHQQGSFTDIIEDKGGGSIFLLHGPPGQGKTLTAETIAEILHRPLYAISVGELGVSPDELEERLRTILDLATVWNAVLLLDEADIFLEARDEKDIVRNAMVGVFLRLLEYHQGVLFLTTNRVKNIDNAFYSRISIGLHFADADTEKRLKIWNNLLGAAGYLERFDATQMASLAERDLNGRQIKNVIRLAQTLARAEETEVSIAHLDRVIELTGQFNPDM